MHMRQTSHGVLKYFSKEMRLVKKPFNKKRIFLLIAVSPGAASKFRLAGHL